MQTAVAAKPKATSYQYGEECQTQLAEKYRNRRANHWQVRVELANRLVSRYALPRLEHKTVGDIVVVDVGCAIGTFAIEFAKLGYRTYGVDFDPEALKLAKRLCREENVSVEFICDDIANWNHDFPPIDIAVCFDIFEHLHDDELGAFLTSIKRQLSKEGSLVFHTFPTQYDYLFFSKNYLRLPLFPLKYLPPAKFDLAVKAYASLLDVMFLLIRGTTHRERIKSESHCNLTTRQRLGDILQRAGYEIVLLESAQLYASPPPRARTPVKATTQKHFAKQPISYRNLYGVAVPQR
jgi:2-polyprenyl-3-methyl-5-hydroxy-6-metoxy-1,4-benzoquinol methylase